MEKAVAEQSNWLAGLGASWDEIAQTVGVAEHVADKSTLIDALAESRRAILEYQLGQAT